MIRLRWASQLALVVDPARQYRRLKRRGFDSWFGKISGVGNGNLLQYPRLGNPMDREVHGVTRIGHN